MQPFIGTLLPPLPSSANSCRKKEIAPIYQCHSPQTNTLKIDACVGAQNLCLRGLRAFANYDIKFDKLHGDYGPRKLYVVFEEKMAFTPVIFLF